MCVRLFLRPSHFLLDLLYDFAWKYFLSRVSLTKLYSFLSRRFKDKRTSEDASDSGFAVRRRGFFVILLKLWGPLMSDMFLASRTTLGLYISSCTCHKLCL